MTLRNAIAVLFLVSLAAACGQTNDPAADVATEDPAADAAAGEPATEDSGLQIKILKNGHGRAAEAGDYVTVHYTGWLYDESAENNRGEKFDSSVDRGDRFQFPLGAQRVIKGWDEGVAGMLIGEKRELTIPPEMGYGSGGAGDVIPPDATLVFEVELFAAEPIDGS